MILLDKDCRVFCSLEVYWLFSRTYMGEYDSPFKSHVSSYGYDLQGFLSERFDGFSYSATE